MLCPHCGQELELVASFCPFCGGMTPVPEQSASEEAPPKVIQRLYPPVQEESTPPAPEPEPSAAEPMQEVSPDALPPAPPSTPNTYPEKKQPKGKKRGSNRRLAILASVTTLIAIICAFSSIYVLANTHGLRVELTKAQTERASAEAAVTSLGSQISELEASLSSVKEERDQLSGQVSELTSKVNSMESSVNQSAYDKEAAQRELQQAQDDVKALSGEITEVRGQLTAAQTALEEETAAKEQLQTDLDTLKAGQKEMEEEIGFYDDYVVFVMLGSSSKYYHKYDCEDFTRRNFLAYSTKLAEANGYSACSKCCD